MKLSLKFIWLNTILLALASILSVAYPSQVKYYQAKEQWDKLSTQDKEKLASNELIFYQQKIPNATWPMLFFFAQIDTSPIEAVAVFAAYEYQKEYIPNLIKSEVVKQISPTENHTAYELKVPWPLPNGKYIHHHKLTQIDKNHYQVTWSLVSSNTTDFVLGKAEFLPFKNKTLFFYQSFVKPKSGVAGLFEGAMVSDVKKSIQAIIKHTQQLKLDQPQVLKQFVEKTQQALHGPNNPPKKN